MIGTFWNLCRACPSIPSIADKNRSEYRSTYQWYEYTGPRQEIVKQAPQPTSPTQPEENVLKGGVHATLINISKRDGEKRLKDSAIDGNVHPEVNIKQNPIFEKRGADLWLEKSGDEPRVTINPTVRIRSRNYRRDYAPSRRSKSEGPPGTTKKRGECAVYGLLPSPEFEADYVLINKDANDYELDTAAVPAKSSRGNTEYRLQFAWPRSKNATDAQEELKLAGGGGGPRRTAYMATAGQERPPVPVHKKRPEKKQGGAELEPLVDHNGDCEQHEDKKEKNTQNGGERVVFHSEYQKKFRPFSQYDYIAGKFLARDGSVTRASNLATESWYAEVVELRKKAGEYRHRGWGTELVPEHLAEVYNKQIALWEHVSRRSSLSALTLATTTQKPRALTKAEKNKENARKLKLHENRQVSVDRASSVLRKKTEKNEDTKRIHSARLPKDMAGKNSENVSTSSSAVSTARSQPAVNGSPKKGTTRTDSAKSPKKLASSGSRQERLARPTTLATTNAQTRNKRETSILARKKEPLKSKISPTATNLNEKRNQSQLSKAINNNNKTDETDTIDKTHESRRIIKSPLETDKILMKSPEQSNWTKPLDTGKTLNTTQKIAGGDVYTHRPTSETKFVHHGLSHLTDCRDSSTSHKSDKPTASVLKGDLPSDKLSEEKMDKSKPVNGTKKSFSEDFSKPVPVLMEENERSAVEISGPVGMLIIPERIQNEPKSPISTTTIESNITSPKPTDNGSKLPDLAPASDKPSKFSQKLMDKEIKSSVLTPSNGSSFLLKKHVENEPESLVLTKSIGSSISSPKPLESDSKSPVLAPASDESSRTELSSKPMDNEPEFPVSTPSNGSSFLIKKSVESEPKSLALTKSITSPSYIEDESKKSIFTPVPDESSRTKLISKPMDNEPESPVLTTSNGSSFLIRKSMESEPPSLALTKSITSPSRIEDESKESMLMPTSNASSKTELGLKPIDNESKSPVLNPSNGSSFLNKKAVESEPPSLVLTKSITSPSHIENESKELISAPASDASSRIELSSKPMDKEPEFPVSILSNESSFLNKKAVGSEPKSLVLTKSNGSDQVILKSVVNEPKSLVLKQSNDSNLILKPVESESKDGLVLESIETSHHAFEPMESEFKSLVLVPSTDGSSQNISDPIESKSKSSTMAPSNGSSHSTESEDKEPESPVLKKSNGSSHSTESEDKEPESPVLKKLNGSNLSLKTQKSEPNSSVLVSSNGSTLSTLKESTTSTVAQSNGSNIIMELGDSRSDSPHLDLFNGSSSKMSKPVDYEKISDFLPESNDSSLILESVVKDEPKFSTSASNGLAPMTAKLEDISEPKLTSLMPSDESSVVPMPKENEPKLPISIPLKESNSTTLKLDKREMDSLVFAPVPNESSQIISKPIGSKPQSPVLAPSNGSSDEVSKPEDSEPKSPVSTTLKETSSIVPHPVKNEPESSTLKPDLNKSSSITSEPVDIEPKSVILATPEEPSQTTPERSESEPKLLHQPNQSISELKNGKSVTPSSTLIPKLEESEPKSSVTTQEYIESNSTIPKPLDSEPKSLVVTPPASSQFTLESVNSESKSVPDGSSQMDSDPKLSVLTVSTKTDNESSLTVKQKVESEAEVSVLAPSDVSSCIIPEQEDIIVPKTSFSTMTNRSDHISKLEENEPNLSVLETSNGSNIIFQPVENKTESPVMMTPASNISKPVNNKPESSDLPPVFIESSLPILEPVKIEPKSLISAPFSDNVISKPDESEPKSSVVTQSSLIILESVDNELGSSLPVSGSNGSTQIILNPMVSESESPIVALSDGSNLVKIADNESKPTFPSNGSNLTPIPIGENETKPSVLSLSKSSSGPSLTAEPSVESTSSTSTPYKSSSQIVQKISVSNEAMSSVLVQPVSSNGSSHISPELPVESRPTSKSSNNLSEIIQTPLKESEHTSSLKSSSNEPNLIIQESSTEIDTISSVLTLSKSTNGSSQIIQKLSMDSEAVSSVCVPSISSNGSSQITKPLEKNEPEASILASSDDESSKVVNVLDVPEELQSSVISTPSPTSSISNVDVMDLGRNRFDQFWNKPKLNSKEIDGKESNGKDASM